MTEKLASIPRGTRIQRSMLGGMLVVALLATLAYTTILLGIRRQAVVREADTQLLAAAEAQRSLLGPGFHDRIADASSVPTAEFARIVAANDDYCRRIGLQYVWSVMALDGRLVFTSATHADLTNAASPCARFLEPHTDPDAFAPALTSTGPVFSTFHNRWGEGRMVLVPEADAKGRLHIFGASMQLGHYVHLVWRTVAEATALGLLILAASMLLSWWMSRRLARPIAELSKSAERMAGGDLDTSLGSSGLLEITMLAHALDSMRLALKKQMETLRASEDRLAATLLSIGDGVIGTDADGRVTDLNPTAEALTGWPAAEARGRPVAEVFRIVHASTRKPVEVPVARALHEGVVVRLASDTILIARDGTERQIADSAAPIRIGSGPILGVVLVFRDVTQEHRMRTELRDSEARFRNLIESAPVAIFIQAERRFAYVNRSAVHAFGAAAAADLIGKPVLDRFHPDMRAAVLERIRTLNEQRKDVPLAEETCLRMDGSAFQAEFSAVPCVHEGRNGAMVFFRDVTGRKRAEEERIELERRIQQTQKLESLGVLAGGIAHDFNNILMAVLGHAGLALEELPAMSPARESIREIEQAARRAADLCRQMLAYSGRGRFTLETIHLRDMVEEMVHLLKTSISKKALLNLHLEPNLPPCRGDPTQIRQIIMNLVINASEAIGDRSGVITLSTGAMTCGRDYLRWSYLDQDLPEGLYVYLEVSDTGCGMDRETQRRIFEPFFTTKFTGRGLGLSAVMGIVRSHKGAVRVYSEPGRGTTFKILFPACEEEAAPVPAGVTDGTAWKGSGTVLLVDDEETVRSLGQKMLEQLGFTVLTATDGREALNVYRTCRSRIAFVLLDLTMPHLNGEETFRELRNIDPNACVVMSSGYTETDIASRFAGKGLAGFIQKPYTKDELRSVLKTVIRERPAQG